MSRRSTDGLPGSIAYAGELNGCALPQPRPATLLQPMEQNKQISCPCLPSLPTPTPTHQLAEVGAAPQALNDDVQEAVVLASLVLQPRECELALPRPCRRLRQLLLGVLHRCLLRLAPAEWLLHQGREAGGLLVLRVQQAAAVWRSAGSAPRGSSCSVAAA